MKGLRGAPAVIARSPCDEAIQGPRTVAPGLLRFARNDGVEVGSLISGLALQDSFDSLSSDQVQQDEGGPGWTFFVALQFRHMIGGQAEIAGKNASIMPTRRIPSAASVISRAKRASNASFVSFVISAPPPGSRDGQRQMQNGRQAPPRRVARG
jgi:hypothetical protein